MKKYFLYFWLLLLLGVLIVFPNATHAQQVVNVYFLHSYTCPHCRAEGAFLDQLEDEYGDRIEVQRYEVSERPDVFQKFSSSVGGTLNGVPVTFIGDQYTVGYSTDQTSGLEIRSMVDVCLVDGCPDLGAQILAGGANLENSNQPTGEAPSQPKLEGGLIRDLPVFGTVDLTRYSLVGLTAVVAAIDGFNPCAMWVLLILVGMLLGMQNRRRMWILGTTFIAASALVYFIFLAAWLEFFRFIGLVRWVQALIGLFAAGVGVYYLRRFRRMKPGECEVTDLEQRRKISDRIKRVVQEKALWIALPGIVVVALIVNLVELACSAGLPAIFTQVLALNDLPRWEYYLYLLLYVGIFMLDDLVVFVVAMVTLKAVGTTGKYSRYATLIGGLAILMLGLLLVFKPEWVMFG